MFNYPNAENMMSWDVSTTATKKKKTFIPTALFIELTEHKVLMFSFVLT